MLEFSIDWRQREVEALTSRDLERCYVPLPVWWQKREVPFGFWTLPGASFWYLESRSIQDEDSSLWMVDAAE